MSKAERRASWRRGRLAEALSLWRLRLAGWRILATNYRSPVGEIDIIARRAGVIAFIEVKARETAADAAAALSPAQRRRIERAAEAFLARTPAPPAATLRFDIMLVLPWRIPKHLADAWRLFE